MKKLFKFLIVASIIAWASGTWADVETYYVNLGSAISGNTTEGNGGVSIMALTGGNIRRSGASQFATGRNPGYYLLGITGVTVSIQQQSDAGNYSDTKFSLFYKSAILNETTYWDAAERKRIFYDMKLSGHTQYQQPFSVPPGSFIRFYWETSGTTVFDGVTANLITGLPPHYFELPKEETYFLYLGTSDSGNSTQPSSTGVSKMLVDGERYKRSESTFVIEDTDKLEGDYFGFQIDTLTISQAQTSGASNYSGVTVTFQYKESMIDETAHWDAAQYIDIITAMALSGNTRYQVQIYPEALGFIRFYMAPSGVTAFDNAKVKFVTR